MLLEMVRRARRSNRSAVTERSRRRSGTDSESRLQRRESSLVARLPLLVAAACCRKRTVGKLTHIERGEGLRYGLTNP